MSKRIKEKKVETMKLDGKEGIISKINIDKYCLPSFQRDFVWKPEQMAKLIESIIRHYPIGTFLLLNYECNKDLGKYSFNGTKESLMHPEYFVIDGQQRLRTILQLLDCGKISDRVLFENCTIDYLNMKNRVMIDISININNIALDEDIKKLSFTKIIKYDDVKLESNDYEGFFKMISEKYERSLIKNYVPIEVLLHDDIAKQWVKIAKLNDEHIRKMRKLKQCILIYEYAVEKIEKKLSSEHNANMFRLLNEAGTDLTQFDLLAAHLYPKDIYLREMWNETKKDKDIHNYDIDPIYILKVLTLIRKVKNGVARPTCAKADIKRIYTLYEDAHNIKKEFSNDWKEASKYVKKSLYDFRNNYGAFRKKYIPYTPMIITLAAIKWWIDYKWDQKFKPNISIKLNKWYWTAIFNRSYDQSTDKKISSQFSSLIPWIDPHSERRSSELTAKFSTDTHNIAEIIVKDIKSSSDARYKALMCLPFTDNQTRDFSAYDFLADQDEIIHDHHIFAKSKLRKKGVEVAKINCAVNRILVTNRTHSKISTKPPFDYLEGAGNATLEKLLLPRLLKEKTATFEEFFDQRVKNIADKLAKLF